jgi:hypothetical protein
VLHGDNGPSMKGTTVLAMLYWLGIAPPSVPMTMRQRAPGILDLRARKDHLADAHAPHPG